MTNTKLDDSVSRLKHLAKDLIGMKKGDVYRLETDKGVHVLVCEDVLEFEN